MVNKTKNILMSGRPETGARWPGCLLTAIVIMLCACQADTTGAILKVGLSEEPRTLNIWLAGDANSRKVLSQIYQPLYERRPRDLKLVPWLAADLPRCDARRQTCTVGLRKVLWSDGTPLTSADVAFTGRLIQEFHIPRYASKWKFIDTVETPDESTVVFHLRRPYATFLSGTLTVPIVPAGQWGPIAAAARKTSKPLAALLSHGVANPIGCGPFVFKQWQKGNFLFLEKNQRFFGAGGSIAGYRLGPFVDGLLFKIYGTSDVAVLALRKGDIDLFWMGIQPGYLHILSQNPHLQIFTNEKSALYFMGFNTRRPPFDDLGLRRAAAILVDKNFIIKRILQGRGRRMDSIIPPGNTQWHNFALTGQGQGLSRPQRIQAAFDLLSQAGYTWQTPPVNDSGDIQPASGIKTPDGRVMAPFTILTPPADYDPHRAMSGMMIQQWLRDLGLPAYARPMHFTSLLKKVKADHDFDAFVLGYGRLSLDPDYLQFFFYSGNDKKNGWNMSGYRNENFDRLALASQNEMNPGQRRKLINRMQSMIGADVPYLPLYDPDLIEAARTDRFTGWVSMIDGIGNPWSFCQVKPREPS